MNDASQTFLSLSLYSTGWMTRQAEGLSVSTLPFGEKGSWPGYHRKERDYHSERPWEGAATSLVKNKEQRKDGVSVSWLWHGRSRGLT